ncbi:phage tail spike protein [Metabacillus sp. 22489]|uniref:phage tail spike protein n=1 Tax=Metabacillus sp. 22489 TaxID=3453928 RepID=UPI003F85BD04
MIHILDYKTERIVGTLENKEETSLFWEDSHKQSLKDNLETFNFTMQADVKESEFVSKRNRIIIPDEDGFFREFIIFEAKQYSDLTKEVYTNGSYTDLKKQKIIEPTTLDNQTISNAGQFVLSDTSYQLGIIEISGTRKIVFENYKDALSALQIIASAFDCELRFRVEVKGNRIIGRYVDFLQQVGGKNGKEIELGKDLIGITRKENTDEIVTALIVLGPEKEDGTRTIVTVKDEDALQRWADKDNRHLWDVYEPEVDQDVTEERLTELGRNELNKRINSLIEYTADTASIEHIFGYEHEKVRLGDTTRIKDTSFEPALYVEARVIEVDRSISDPSAKSYVLGDFIEYSEEDIMARFKKLQAILQQKVSAGEITAIREYVDQQDQVNYEDSTRYADVVSDTAKTEAVEVAATDATQKADNAKTEAINTAATDATQKANAAESNAKSYAETKAEEAKTAAIAAVKLQIETNIATAEVELKKYSDDAAAQAELDAKNYTDGVKTQIETAMTSHANSVAANAEKAAKLHADSVGTTVESAAKKHADSQAAAAQTNAQNFAKNASNINSGTLNGSVVNITNLNASNIVSGNMSADFIYGGTINGTTVNIINLNAANIKSGTLDTARLATSSITADKLVIGDFTNLCENPDFEGDTVGSTPKGYADSALAKVLDISTYQNGNGSSKALGLNARNNGNSDIYGTNLIPVKAGQKFYLEAEARYLNTAGTGYGRIGFNRYDENKNMLSNWDSVASWGSTSKETSFTKKSGVYTVPHNGYIRLWVSFANNAETSNVFVVDNIRVHRMTSSELIVDGSITADKINVSNLAAITANLGTVTAGSIDAAKVTITNLNASNINAGTLSADRIGSKTITSDKINVTSLSALSANLGTVTAGTLKAVTLESATGNFSGDIKAYSLRISNTDVYGSQLTFEGGAIVGNGKLAFIGGAGASGEVIDNLDFHVGNGQVTSSRPEEFTNLEKAHMHADETIMYGSLEVKALDQYTPMLRFNTARPWAFKQEGTDASTSLVLKSESDGKYFIIRGSDDTAIASFYSNAGSSKVVVRTIYAENWVRSTGSTGWFNETYGGGIYMTDTADVRVYNGKNFRVDGLLKAYKGANINGAITLDTPINSLAHAALPKNNGWTDYDTVNYIGASYTKSADGFVKLRGMVTSGAVGTVIGTLPVGCRPFKTEVFPVQTSSGEGRIDVQSNGYVILRSGGTGWVSLSGIIFKAEN